MKKLLLLVPVLLLSGCFATAPVVPKWPDVPADLLEACPGLKTVDKDNHQISTLLDVVSDNYKEYYDCRDKVNDWITWYKGNQKIWEQLK